MSQNDTVSRRKALLSLGFGATAMIAAPALAQTTITRGPIGPGPRPIDNQLVLADTPISNVIKRNPAILNANLTDPRAVAQLQLTKRLPDSTPIGKMLTPEGVSALTPGARKLTKGDLVLMQAGRISAAARGLSVRDIASIQGAFGRPGGLAASVDVSCCCCTPCCCAAAVDSDLALAA